MRSDSKTSLVLAVLTAVFAGLAVAFVREPARPSLSARPLLVPPNTIADVPGTIRISAAELVRTGGDTSVLQCYSCHDPKKPPQIRFDANHRVVLPKEHADLIFAMRNCGECHPPSDPVQVNYTPDGAVILPPAHQDLGHMAHGRYLRNEYCYNCHDPNRLDHLHTPEGTEIGFDQATQLCAGCHGTQYRDWEAGAHGRRSGYWDRAAGPMERQECTSCHDPHAPKFTPLIPLPPPHALHA